ncbi:peptidoglycan editing factor PgeF [Telmatobacter bradus]|uniref:peptidoglycan editing factor PgeF n=1 Tax=Telmatobacter bradus TaxID=474953 RepID=UPI003B428D8E
MPSKTSSQKIVSAHGISVKTAGELQRPASQPVVASNGVQWLAVPGWEEYPWLKAGFSTRKGGKSRVYAAPGAPAELNLGFTKEDSAENVAANRNLLAAAVRGSDQTPLVALQQIHSNLCRIVTAEDAEHEPPFRADGQISNTQGLLLGIQTADCIPVLVADRRKKVVAAFHAGWRGTVQRIVELGVGRMVQEFGSEPTDLLAAIGPGVGSCCYAVGEEVRQEFQSQFSYVDQLFHRVSVAPAASSLHLDLIEANRRQLLAAGLPTDAIQIVGGCTSCHTELFYSYRNAKGITGRMMAVIGVFTEAE